MIIFYVFYCKDEFLVISVVFVSSVMFKVQRLLALNKVSNYVVT